MQTPTSNHRPAGRGFLLLVSLLLCLLLAACSQPGGNGDGGGNGGDGNGSDDGGGDDGGGNGPTEVTVSVSDLKYTGYGEPLQGQSYTVTFRWTTGVEGADTLTCQLDLGDDTPARFIRDSCLGAQQVTHTYDALAETTFVDLLVSHDGVSELRSVTISAQPSEEPDPADEREHWLQLINLARSSPQRCGDIEMPAVAPLSWDDRLGRAAQLHSEYMAETGSFSHTGRDGSNLGQRLIDQGYLYSYGSENITLGQPLYEIAMDGWLNSPGHCANIMSPRVVHVGVGMARSATGVPIWTQDFASPR